MKLDLKANAHAYRVQQARDLLVACGWIEREDGKFTPAIEPLTEAQLHAMRAMRRKVFGDTADESKVQEKKAALRALLKPRE